MNRIYSNFNDYKDIILQEVIFEKYYLSDKDAIEHINLFTPKLKEFFENKTSIAIVLKWIMIYD